MILNCQYLFINNYHISIKSSLFLLLLFLLHGRIGEVRPVHLSIFNGSPLTPSQNMQIFHLPCIKIKKFHRHSYFLHLYIFNEIILVFWSKESDKPSVDKMSWVITLPFRIFSFMVEIIPEWKRRISFVCLRKLL